MAKVRRIKLRRWRHGFHGMDVRVQNRMLAFWVGNNCAFVKKHEAIRLRDWLTRWLEDKDA